MTRARWLAEGNTVGHLRLGPLLGRGGMGTVWEAWPVAGGPPVALKVLDGPAAESPALRRRFLREARALAALRHPTVVAIEGVLDLDGTPAIVMERLVGETLRARLVRDERLPLAETARILADVADAAVAAHALGVVHRDLKPENVFLHRGAASSASSSPSFAQRDEVRVLDFGIARLTATSGALASSLALTGASSSLGTLGYMPLEQMLGDAVDARADVWSIGAMVYECLSGGQPVAARTLPLAARALRDQGITPIASLVPGLPADVASVVSAALAVDVANRLADAATLRDVLRRHAA